MRVLSLPPAALRRASALAALLLLAAAALAAMPAAAAGAAIEPVDGLLSGVNGTFDGGTGSWNATSATVASVASPVTQGSGALAVTTTAVGPADVAVGSGTGGATWVPAVPGIRYQMTMWTRAAQTGRTVAPVLMFYNSAGTLLDSAWGQTVVDSPTAWQQTRPMVGIAPDNTAYAAVYAVVYGTVQGETHYLDAVTLTSKSLNVPAVVGPLQTSGNAILDGNGSRIVLRGLHRYGLEGGTSLTNFTSDEIEHAQEWGANQVRVSLDEADWLSTSCKYDSTYAGKVDSIVDWVTSRGMVAMLDLHFNTIQPCADGWQHRMADQDAITFWTEVASRYKDNPLVVFDLYNEPHDIPDDVWLNGGPVTEGTTEFQAVGMQQLYDAVRATGATNLVFISGNDWANRLPAARVSGFNIVYAVHAYTCPNQPPPNCAAARPYDPSPILSNFIPVGQTAPVMVTEFGWPGRADGTYVANVIAFAEAQGWGWSTFVWDGKTGGLFGLASSIGPTKGYQPNAVGNSVVLGFEKNQVTVPTAPTGASAIGDDGSATVSWTAPVSNGGAPITSYTVTASPGGKTVTTANATTTAATVTGLTNDTTYTFTVRATNSAGDSLASAPSNSVTPKAVAVAPQAPTGVVAVPGNGMATLSWAAPFSDGGAPITGYTVAASPGGATVTTPSPSAVVTGLTNGTAYTFTVRATNSAGDSPESGPSNPATPRTVPSAPSGVAATAGNGTATVSWAPPASDGGAPITGYTVTASPGGTTVTTSESTTSAVVTGLTNGTTYTFTVRATNVAGDSPASSPSNSVRPVAPPSVTVKSPNGGESWSRGSTRTITWTAPSLGGRLRIELYRNGSRVSTLASSVVPSSGAYSWRIPKTMLKASTYTIKLTSTSTPSITDTSNGPFALT